MREHRDFTGYQTETHLLYVPVYGVCCVLNAQQNERNTECFTLQFLQHTTNCRRLKAVTSFTSLGSKNKREPGSESLRPRRINKVFSHKSFAWQLYFKQLMMMYLSAKAEYTLF